MPHILIVDDDIQISEMLTEKLETEGYTVSAAYSGTEALMFLVNTSPDLILLDLMLPGISGEKLLLQIKDIPVIVVSAKADVTDKVELLLGGAADYVTKPFSPSELMARVDAIYRRVAMINSPKENSDDEIVSGEFSLNAKNRVFTKNNIPIDLTQVEFQIMEYFFQNQGSALGRTAILNKVWGDSHAGEEKIVDVNIRRIRKKMRD